MLDVALQFLRNELKSYMLARTGTESVDVKPSKIADETGKYAFDSETIGACLINIEEERTLMSQLPEYTYTNGQHVVLEPRLKLNLYVMFAANFKQYDVALKYLSLILTFFQSHPYFSSEQYPALDPRIEKLVVELQSLNYEQLNQVWTFIGGEHLPSVVYRMRMVAVQDEAQTAVQPPLTIIKSSLQSR